MLFDSSLRKELARSFGATLVVLVTVVMTMTLIRTVGEASRGTFNPTDVMIIMGYTVLSDMPTILSLSLFIAILSVLTRMYKDSEMVIWFASGLGLARIVRPVFQMAWPVLLAVGALVLFVWPWGNRSSVELRGRYEQRTDLSRVAPGVFQTSRDGSRVFFVDRTNEESVEGHHVFVLTRKPPLESVVSARSGRIDNEDGEKVLTLVHGQRNETDSLSGVRTLSSFESYRLLVDDTAVRGVHDSPPKTLDTLVLLQDPTPRHLGELAWRFGLLLAAANLLLLGIGLSATQPRRASNWNLLLALLTFIAYFNAVNLTQAWIASGRFEILPAMLTLHGGALGLGLALIWWRDHAAVWRPLGTRTSA